MKINKLFTFFIQIEEETKKFATPLGIRTVAVIGGVSLIYVFFFVTYVISVSTVNASAGSLRLLDLLFSSVHSSPFFRFI